MLKVVNLNGEPSNWNMHILNTTVLVIYEFYYIVLIHFVVHALLIYISQVWECVRIKATELKRILFTQWILSKFSR